MPKAGVGSWNSVVGRNPYKPFQSIYAQSRRWKNVLGYFFESQIGVSIHLCPKQALEEVFPFGMHADGTHCFNPFMPKAGVGRLRRYTCDSFVLPVSIHLCPKQALEALRFMGAGWKFFSFNPFMPKAGVGSTKDI